MPATLKCDTITNASNAGTANLSLDASGNATVGNTLAMGSSFLRNRIINGAMAIDQRNAGASYPITTSTTYGSCDRYFWLAGANSVFTAQQVTTGNTDFPNALRVQRTASSVSTTTIYYAQIIETVNCQDLAGQLVTWSFYATAGTNFSAASSALSYQLWTGTGTDQGSSSFNNGTWTSGAVTASGNVTVSTTRTRFTITATIPAGTKEIGLRWYWAGAGTALANDYVDITGVQLEVGSIATPFERRQYGQELALCQRYFQFGGYNFYGSSLSGSTTTIEGANGLSPPMRSAPSVSLTSGVSVQIRQSNTTADYTASSPALANTSTTNYGIWTQISGFTGLTASLFCSARNNSGASQCNFLSFSSEL